MTASTVLPFRPQRRVVCEDAVSAIAWSPGGKTLACASLSGDIQLWTRGSDQDRDMRLEGHRNGTLCLQWMNEATLASGGADAQVRMWNMTDGTSTALPLAAGKSWVECLALSPDRNLLAVGAGATVSLWNKDGSLFRNYPKLNSTVADLVWHPKGKNLASVSNAKVSLWRAGNDTVQKEFLYPASLLLGRWSPKGDWFVAGCQDCSVHIWITATGEDLQMSGYPRKIRELSFHPGGRWLAVGGSTDITVWDFSGEGPAGTTPKMLTAHDEFVTQVAFSPDGKWLASTGEDGLVLLWPAEGVPLPVAGYKAEAAMTHLAWKPDSSQFAAGGLDGKVDVFPVPGT